MNLLRRSIPPVVTLVVVLALGAGATRAAEESRPTAKDVASMRTIESLVISPDGQRLAYVLTEPTFDPKAQPKDDDTTGGWKRTKRLWVAPVGGEAPRPWTGEEGEPREPRWAPDGGSIAFLRKTGDKVRIQILPAGGGEARVLDTGKLEPGSLGFSPDGTRVAFTATPQPTDDEKRAAWASGGAIRWDREWKPSRLWIVPLGGGEPVEAYRGPEHVVDFRWSPDGKRFALLLAASSDPYEAANVVRPAIVTADGTGAPRWLEPAGRNVQGLAWSPDGRFVAYQWGARGLSLLDEFVVAEAAGPGRWNAAAKLDPTLIGFVWRADSRSLVAHVAEKTESKLYDLAYDGSRATDLGFAGRVIAGGLEADRRCTRLAFSSSTPDEAASPTIFDLATKRTSVVVEVNPEVKSWSHGKLEVVSWTNPEGVRIEGTLLVSPLAKSGVPGPLLVMPHGGPDSVTTKAFSAMGSFFAARGYSVFKPNYRGGIGYGFDFYAANRGRLGEIEFMDIESGVDALIASGRADPKRLFYGGWSWGGYLTTWTIGHTTRYRAAVAGAAVVDAVTQYVLSDINHGVAAQWEFKGDPWRNPEVFDRANPMRSLAKATTPTLILHGQSDDRVPFMQGQILYRALADVGCEVEFLAYPREPHGFKEPAHDAHRLDAWAEWYRRREQ